MREDVKIQWLKDLRDPARRQAYGHLENAYGGQCCLGVLCEQAVKAGVIAAPKVDEGTDMLVYYWGEPTGYCPEGRHSETMLLPDPVREWAGLDEFNPTVRFTIENEDDEAPFVTNEILTELNDTYRFTFPEIADCIEESL